MALFPLISYKQNIVTDLKFKSYLLIDYLNCSNEKIAVSNILVNFSKFKKQAHKKHFPQIQIKFPYLWHNFSRTIENFGFKKGLFFVNKRVNKNPTDLMDRIHLITKISIIKNPLIAQQKLHYNLNPDFFDNIKTFNSEDYLNEIQNSVNNGSGMIFGAYKGEELAGFIGLEKLEPGYYILELFVDPKYRKAGLGTKLCNAGMGYVKKEKAEIIWTTLSTENLRALHFYEKLGFKITATLGYLNLTSHKT